MVHSCLTYGLIFVVWIAFLAFLDWAIGLSVYGRFKARNEGKKFFIYKGHKVTGHLINEKIVPAIDQDIEPVIVTQKGNVISSESNGTAISIAVKKLRRKPGWLGFPVILLISKRRIYARSLNVEFYRLIHRNEPIEPFAERIGVAFQELQTDAHIANQFIRMVRSCWRAQKNGHLPGETQDATE